MTEQQRITVPAREGRSFRLSAGQSLTVVDVEGSQIGDLVLFSATDIHERLSTSCTRSRCGRLEVLEGDQLFSTEGRPMVTIVEDRVGAHDIVSHPCDKSRYELDFQVIRARQLYRQSSWLAGAIRDRRLVAPGPPSTSS